MFSGIIGAVGRIDALTPRNDGTPTVRLSVAAGDLDLSDVALGDSIACNGVCLTVVDKNASHFCVDVSPETLSCTVGLDAPGPINLEKALRLADRLGGEVLRFDALGDNRVLVVRAPQPLARYIARKGSITLNGVSLTTNTVENADFSINLIPHTLAATTLGGLHPGHRVNLEIDLIARYCERMLSYQNTV